MRGEALNPADDFILHSTIFCLDYVSRHIWGKSRGSQPMLSRISSRVSFVFFAFLAGIRLISDLVV
jgi:hypothetical protein